MIRLAVFDSDPANRALIKKSIIKYTMQSLKDFDILWFLGKKDSRKIAKYAPSMNLALISLDSGEDSIKEIGETVYRINEDCRIVYYSTEKRDLEPLLRVRPRGYYKMDSGEAGLFECIDDIVCELKNSMNVFCFETRRDIILIPLRNILFFQSDLKYVTICLKNGKTERIYAKLSELEPRMNSDFLRIHKSYFVNTRHVRYVNKSEKTVLLQNDISLPISDANYKATIIYFSKKEKQYEF